MPVNVEIKARCANPDRARNVLISSGARRVGLDHQIDTYFQVPNGRLKLRQGNIETNLIQYHRKDGSSPKTSAVRLFQPRDPEGLRAILVDSLGVLAVVDKKREIFLLGDVKFHLDQVEGLGSFVEIEVIADIDPPDSEDEASHSVDHDGMHKTCREWMSRLRIADGDLLAHSYSDMIVEKG